MDSDIAACEQKLGKEPQIGTSLNQNQNVTMSKNIADRLQSAGTVDSDRLDNYDNYWMNKLACIDESHSVRNNLDIEEVEQKLQSILKYTQSSDVKRDFISEEISEKDRVSTEYNSVQTEVRNLSRGWVVEELGGTYSYLAPSPSSSPEGCTRRQDTSEQRRGESRDSVESRDKHIDSPVVCCCIFLQTSRTNDGRYRGTRAFAVSVSLLKTAASVKECFEMSPGHTLRCSSMVENFVEEVDRLMYDAVRKDPSASYQLSDKKLTYAERFKRDFKF
ncbi:uncharacterized protein [Venturia canescens]|uniref:uncharacterized protein n=1 Tax=Venturia canescens TaxID=32260 RepID=UPI001C9BD82D|nr:uncharacterized protein LOC122412356 [Venturia canescens]